MSEYDKTGTYTLPPTGDSEDPSSIEIFSSEELESHRRERGRQERPPRRAAEASGEPEKGGTDRPAALSSIFEELVPVFSVIGRPTRRQEVIEEASRRSRDIFRCALEEYYQAGLPNLALVRELCQTHSRCLSCERTSYFGVEQAIRQGTVTDRRGARKTYDTVLLYSVFLEKADDETTELTIPLVWDGTQNLRAGFVGEAYRANSWYSRTVREADRRRLEYSVSSFKWSHYGGVPVFITPASGIQVQLAKRFQPGKSLGMRCLLQFFNKQDSTGQLAQMGFQETDRIKSEIYAFAFAAVLTEFLAKYPLASARFVPQADKNRLIRGLKRSRKIRDRGP